METKNIRLCYRTAKEVGLVQDSEGNNEEGFVCLKLVGVKTYNLPKDKYVSAQEGMREYLAKQLDCDISLITPITLNEYLDYTEEEPETTGVLCDIIEKLLSKEE